MITFNLHSDPVKREVTLYKETEAQRGECNDHKGSVYKFEFFQFNTAAQAFFMLMELLIA